MGDSTVRQLEAGSRTVRRRMPADARREQLLRIADDVVAAHGAAVSMSEIAAAAGVTKPLLYRHFASKSELYTALARRGTAMVREAVQAALGSDAPPRRRVAAAVDAYLQHIEARAEGYRLLTRAAQREAVEVATTIAAFTDELADDLAASMTRDLPASADLDALALTWSRAIVGAVITAGDLWLDRQHVTRSQLVEQLLALLWGGFGAAADAGLSS